MIGDILQPTHLLLILVVALLVLGPKRLPEVGRSLGRGLRDFRSAISGEDQPEEVAEQTTAPAGPAPAPASDSFGAPAPASDSFGAPAPAFDAAAPASDPFGDPVGVAAGQPAAEPTVEPPERAR